MSLAQVLLPMGTFAETSGTYVNVEGRWQDFRGCATPVGEVRPAWRSCSVPANLLGLEGFDYESSAEVLAELRGLAGGAAYDGRVDTARESRPEAPRHQTTTLSIYADRRHRRRAGPAARYTRPRTAPGGEPEPCKVLFPMDWLAELSHAWQSTIVSTFWIVVVMLSIVVAVAMTLAERKVIGY